VGERSLSVSWRRGELWFDTDVLWFGEAVGVAPAILGFTPAPIPGLASPPGLVASRVRRAAWKRRRHARRARATALALSPAVMLMLAGLRSGGDPGTSAAVEDPPSLTVGLGWTDAAEAEARLDPLKAVSDSVGVARGSPPPSRRQRVHRSVARANAFPKVEWHHATSVGLPYDGSLIHGTQFPVKGPGWVTWDPATDSVPNAPKRLYGNEHTIRRILAVIRAYSAANPRAPRVVIGDISRDHGGPMDEHVSHQNGLDVDIYYPRLDGQPRAPSAGDGIDHRLAQDLLDRFVAAGAKMVFVGYSSGLHGPAEVVIPYPSHEYHMHVRFPPPGG
jgi:Penicillin-insensitive murein endopeptidase